MPGSAVGNDSEAGLKGRFGFDECEEGLADVFAGGGVVQDGGAVGCGERGQDRGGRVGADDVGFRAGGEGERELVGVGVAIGVGDLDEDDGGGKVGEFDPVEDADGGDGAGLGAEPALAGEVGGEEFLHEGEAGAGEQSAPGSR